jgi:hypothetical protein
MLMLSWLRSPEWLFMVGRLLLERVAPSNGVVGHFDPTCLFLFLLCTALFPSLSDLCALPPNTICVRLYNTTR